MHLSQILHSKGSHVVTTEPGVTLLEAVRKLVDRNIGALVVVEGRRTVGILTERDLLRFQAGSAAALDAVQVADLMTRDVITAEAADTVQHAMDTMTEHRVRHLPILDRGELVGIVSIGDLVNHLRLQMEEENHHLRDYIAHGG